MYCCSRFSILFLAVLWLSSCHNREEILNQSKGSFFDLEEKIMEDIKELREQNYALSKSVSFEEGKEETVIENPDWETELQTLIQLNINKAQWVEKYSVDTVISGNQSTITYQAFSAAIPVKRMVIKQQDGEVSEIFVSYGRRNILFTSKNQIRYIPFDSFLIKGSQKALFLSNHNYEVSGKMIRKNE